MENPVEIRPPEVKHFPPTREEIEAWERFHAEFKQCANCYRWLPKNHKWLRYANTEVCSEQCYQELDRRVKDFQRRRRELEEKLERWKYEREHNVTPFIDVITITVKGLKRDIDRFKRDLPEILRRYNLE
jgi:predicted phage-related endonuclease